MLNVWSIYTMSKLKENEREHKRQQYLYWFDSNESTSSL